MSSVLQIRGPGDTSCPVVIDVDAEKYGLFRLYKVKTYKFILLSIYILTTFCETNELAYRQHEEGEHLLIMEEPESGGKYSY